MKLYILLLSLAASAFAQSVLIAAPAPNATITPGSNFTVSVEKPASLTFTDDVSVAIGLRSCGGDCSGLMGDGLFDVIFKGDYNPQMIPGSQRSAEFQNYTVQAPTTLASGPALLSIAHFFLGSASLSPENELVQEVLQVP